MFDKLLSSLSTGKGLGKSLLMAERFGLLPESVAVFTGGLRRATPPTMTTLGPDWIKNLDVLSHAGGCVVAGIFDNLVEGMSAEELTSLTEDEVNAITSSIPMGQWVSRSFEVCKEAYLQGGPLSDQISSGTLKPEGLSTMILMQPLVKKRIETQESEAKGPSSLLGRLRESAGSKKYFDKDIV